MMNNKQRLPQIEIEIQATKTAIKELQLQLLRLEHEKHSAQAVVYRLEDEPRCPDRFGI